MGIWVSNLRIWASNLRIWDPNFRVWDANLGIWATDLRVWDWHSVSLSSNEVILRLKPGVSEAQMLYSETQSLKPVVLKDETGNSETQMGPSWAPNQTILIFKIGSSELNPAAPKTWHYREKLCMSKAKPSNSETQTGISETQTRYFWGCKDVVLRPRLCNAEIKPGNIATQTQDTWDLKPMFLRPKPGIFWGPSGTVCWNFSCISFLSAQFFHAAIFFATLTWKKYLILFRTYCTLYLPHKHLSFMLDNIGVLADPRRCTNTAYHYRKEQSVDVTAMIQHEVDWFNAVPP